MAITITRTFPLEAAQKPNEPGGVETGTETEHDGHGNNRNSKERSNEIPPILRIPPDVLAVMDGHFIWSDRFHLSQTCRALRSYWGGSWIERVGDMPEEDKLEFWFGIAYNLPNYWVCNRCCDIHGLRTRDTPKRPRTYDCRRKMERISYVWGYLIDQRHIQLALKYYRLENTNPRYSRYLARLLASRTAREWFYCPDVSSPHSSRLDLHYEPRVVNGQFILSKTSTFSAKWWSLKSLHVGRWNHFLCPHERLLPTIPVYNSLRQKHEAHAGELGRVVKEACDSPGKEVTHHCTQCPLDYAVTLCHERKLRIEAWYDLGSYGPELAYLWKTSRTPVSHVPGSIRALYNGQ